MALLAAVPALENFPDISAIDAVAPWNDFRTQRVIHRISVDLVKFQYYVQLWRDRVCVSCLPARLI